MHYNNVNKSDLGYSIIYIKIYFLFIFSILSLDANKRVVLIDKNFKVALLLKK